MAGPGGRRNYHKIYVTGDRPQNLRILLCHFLGFNLLASDSFGRFVLIFTCIPIRGQQGGGAGSPSVPRVLRRKLCVQGQQSHLPGQAVQPARLLCLLLRPDLGQGEHGHNGSEKVMSEQSINLTNVATTRSRAAMRPAWRRGPHPLLAPA